MPQYSINAASIIIWINNQKYNSAQSISFNVDYGESLLYGIDSQFAQEIVPGKVAISGNISGIRVRNSGGIQAISARSLIVDIISSPYISLRIQDRVTQEDILFIPRCKVTSESHSAAAKGTYKLSFSFLGILPEWALDRQS
jgi:hypothetical protein